MMYIFLLRSSSTKPSSSPSSSRPLSMDTSPSHRLLQMVLIVALFSSTKALIGSDDEQAVKFNSQFILRDNPSTQLKSRLATLLELKRSIAELMKERKEQHVTTDDINDEEDQELVTRKRVFCNGFTGCGGRFRGYRSHHNHFLEDMRKRVLKAAASKRPFCNNNGCFNGGKRKKNDNTENSVTSDRAFSIQEDLTDSNQQPLSTPKRLFCNGYGGCRNMGKRGLIPSLMVEKQTSARQSPSEERKPMLEILLQPNKEKRFFASSYDATMDDFLDDLS